MINLRFGIVVVVLIGKPPLMGEVLCSTENSPFLIIDHIHAKINRVCCAASAIGKQCMNVRKNKLFSYTAKLYVPHGKCSKTQNARGARKYTLQHSLSHNSFAECFN